MELTVPTSTSTLSAFDNFLYALKAKETLTQAKQLSKIRYLTIIGYETNSSFGF